MVQSAQPVMAKVILTATLRDLAGSDDVEVPGATVAAILDELERRHPRLRGWILDEQRRLRRHVNVFVNDSRADLGTAVAAEDAVYILPAISGGRHSV